MHVVYAVFVYVYSVDRYDLVLDWIVVCVEVYDVAIHICATV